jgi:hypothetical protein
VFEHFHFRPRREESSRNQLLFPSEGFLREFASFFLRRAADIPN